MYEIATSFLNLEKGSNVSEIILNLEKARTDYYHIDVMDGKFVEKNTYEWMRELSSYIKRISNLPQDVHLMVEDIKSAINDFSAVEPNIITFHYEACKSDEEIMEIKKETTSIKKKSVGKSNAKTKNKSNEYFLKFIYFF